MPVLPAPDQPGRGRRRRSTAVRLAVGVAGAAAAAVSPWAVAHQLDRRSADRMGRAMYGPVRSLTAGAGWEVDDVTVHEYRARFAERDHRVPLTFADVRGPDGHTFDLEIRNYDPSTMRAESVAWVLTAPPLPAGWRVVTYDGSTFVGVAQKEIDHRLVQVVATASLRDDRVEYAAGHLTVDGVATTPAETPRTVRAEVEPLLARRTAPLPLPGVETDVSSWFDWSEYREPLPADFLRVQLRTGPIRLGDGTS